MHWNVGIHIGLLNKRFTFIFRLCVCECVMGLVHVTSCRSEASDFPRAGSTGSCKSTYVGAGT